MEWIDPILRSSSCMYYNIKQNVAARVLPRVINKLDAWAVERGLIFSTNKTVNMVFRKRRKNEESIEKVGRRL